jgi:uncharacterized protein
MAHGEISHIEFPADDVERAKRFYGELFGWEFSPMEGFDSYWLFRTATPEASGGAIGKRNEAVASDVTVYVTVDSIEQALAKVPGLGGTVTTGKTEIPDFGWYAILNDTEGSLLGLYEVAPR